MSSSSKRKRPLIQKCRHCDCFFLAKDIDEHRLGQQTPKGPMARQPQVGEGRCDVADYTDSQFALIKPHFGMALRQHSKAYATTGASRGEAPFPVPLCGWMLHNSALIHPETLTVAGLRPRSAVLCLLEGGQWTERLLSLWPNAEVPPMRILLPNSVPFCGEASLLVRLAILSTSSEYISTLCLQPNLTASDLLLEHCTNLAELSHFPLFARSYFGDAFICDHFDELALSYYGQRFVFRISNIEFGNNGSERKQMDEEKVMNGAELKIEEKYEMVNGRRGTDRAQDKRHSGKIYRISPMCTFKFCWDEVKERREDDPESLC